MDNKIKKPRRHPLAKEKFLEGNRQKFTLILIFCAIGILVCDVNFHINPDIYLKFLGYIGMFFLGGATATAWVTANKSETVNQNTHQDIRQETVQTVNQNIKQEVDYKASIIHEGDFGAPANRPFAMLAIGE